MKPTMIIAMMYPVDQPWGAVEAMVNGRRKMTKPAAKRNTPRTTG
jgi:hypothetical protein